MLTIWKLCSNCAPFHQLSRSSRKRKVSTTMPPGKHLIVLVNPNSGQGLAQNMFYKNLQPVLQELQIPYQLVLTEYAGHAKELLQTADLNELRGIVVVSGDGLVYEVYNGLYSRADWDTALRTPVGVVPGGSGNGLARSISHYSRKSYTKPANECSTIVAKGNPTLMDLVFVETSAGELLVSFLSLGWGIIADIDIDSERLRSIGELRFSVWALARIASLKHYKGRLYYLPIDEKDIPPRKIAKKMSRRMSQDLGSAINGNGLEDMYREGVFRSLSEPFDSVENDKSELVSRLQEVPKLGEPLDIDNPRKGMRLLPPLDQPLPDNFRCIQGSFYSVYAVYQPFIASESKFAPEAKLNDGIIWLSIIKKGVTRKQLVQYLTVVNSMEGDQRDMSFVEYIPVKALRLEPETSNTYLTVDGEKVSYGPIQAEVAEGTAQVLTQYNS